MGGSPLARDQYGLVCYLHITQGEELGPLELKIEGLKKQVVDSVQECNKMQEFWLRQQNELVKQTKSSEEQREAINSLEKRLLIMDQKKLRLDGRQ